MPQLTNKIAIVTGAASGFGAGIARSYIEAGAKVVLADINGEAAQRLAEELGPNACAATCDVTNGEQVQAAVQLCVDTFGIPDIVVNNAGTTHRNQPLMNVDEKTFDRVFAVNVKSIFHMVKAVVPLMRERKNGSIINVGSVAGIRPRPGLTWYNGSKGAVNLLSKSLAVELGPDGIRVNNICPVMGETALLEDFMGVPDTPENRARFVATIPLGRLSKPSDIAAVAVFLASDEAAFLNGVELPVDGGRVV
ncbi:SDR family oxidoreductase [Phytopseudomonas seleniipraecipitans]|uniref:3-oxoacyl-[acyl-carrier protein] reductase n=1 Tax=Phytopseudomonas seleniipraecipitans TaxID=640205 RepID=A0A1G7SUD2_9GAMM|nr:SDR family oxidoreductase [Pseudomonas seleniipraecipitans]SDG26687.1 3-oxoacyl-[acyl-carrier protein] reductase [Pseudomonas seleniipraecipitans]